MGVKLKMSCKYEEGCHCLWHLFILCTEVISLFIFINVLNVALYREVYFRIHVSIYSTKDESRFTFQHKL